MRKSKWTKEILAEAVVESFSMASVMRKLGLKLSGGNHYNITSKIRFFGIDTSHFTGGAHLRGKTHNWSTRIPLENILIENSNYLSRSSLKIRLFKEGLLKNQCYECGCQPEWRGEKLALHLDHINGVSNDHRVENLRMLCPNCHSQTSTYSNKKR